MLKGLRQIEDRWNSNCQKRLNEKKERRLNWMKQRAQKEAKLGWKKIQKKRRNGQTVGCHL